MVCLPILVYITLSTDEKTRLSVGDIVTIISSFLSILFGFILVVEQPEYSYVVCLLLSCAFSCFIFTMFFGARTQLQRAIQAQRKHKYNAMYLRRVELCNRKFFFSLFLMGVIPIFPAIYFMSMAGSISDDVTFSLFMAADVALKVVFTMVATDAHLEVIPPSTLLLVAEMHANEARKGFLKYVFHEVRVPLNSVSLGIDLLQKSDKLESSEKEALQMMRDSASYVCDILNEAQSLQKISEGKNELKEEVFKICDIVDKVLKAVHPYTLDKLAEIQVDILDGVPRAVVGDPMKVQHALANLVMNALKHNSSGVKVNILVSRTPSSYWTRTTTSSMSSNDEHEISWEVRDNGTGIPEELHPLLFQPYMFVRPGDITADADRGPGIGLHICKQIVDLLGGTVFFESSPGNGSTFGFSIPLRFGFEEAFESSKMSRRVHTHREGGGPGDLEEGSYAGGDMDKSGISRNPKDKDKDYSSYSLPREISSFIPGAGATASSQWMSRESATVFPECRLSIRESFAEGGGMLDPNAPRCRPALLTAIDNSEVPSTTESGDSTVLENAKFLIVDGTLECEYLDMNT